MHQNLVVDRTIDILAPVSQVWDFITTPEGMKEYLFGIDAVSEWTVGSPITFSGELAGKPFEDKGLIEQFDKDSVFAYSWYSSFTGVPDLLENYTRVRIALEKTDKGTRLKLRHSNFPTRTAFESQERYWYDALETIKERTEVMQPVY